MNVLGLLPGVAGIAGPGKLALFSKEEACCFYVAAQVLSNSWKLPEKR